MDHTLRAPIDVFVCVFDHLTRQELVSCGTVCRRWRDAAMAHSNHFCSVNLSAIDWDFEARVKRLSAAFEHSERWDVRLRVCVDYAHMPWRDRTRNSDDEMAWPSHGPLLRDVILPGIRRSLTRLVHLEIASCEGTAHLVQAALATFGPAPQLRSLDLSVWNFTEEPTYHPILIPHDVFHGIAPTLHSVDLNGCVLSHIPSAAFSSVITLKFRPFPRYNVPDYLASHFPAVKHVGGYFNVQGLPTQRLHEQFLHRDLRSAEMIIRPPLLSDELIWPLTSIPRTVFTSIPRTVFSSIPRTVFTTRLQVGNVPVPALEPFLDCFRHNPAPVHLAFILTSESCIQMTFSYSPATSAIPIERTYKYAHDCMVGESILVLTRMCDLVPHLTSLDISVHYLSALPRCFPVLPGLKALRVEHITLVDSAIRPLAALDSAASVVTQCPQLTSVAIVGVGPDTAFDVASLSGIGLSGCSHILRVTITSGLSGEVRQVMATLGPEFGDLSCALRTVPWKTRDLYSNCTSLATHFSTN
ncbi:hypothetical protein EXIGLDRAFT_43258 [Exidia glandulosa HHB12029]|uniref:F-box domain-containing protein n=1 Tax=Exidia glandulosa HHB12029 TaxID=1314781 RepID=A0A165IJS1_EXIGL|nr:hypothetical protein EXIGLDRAFT_43258 [Exidia glandulosa HHB12029]